jgi:hypothetical protein
LPFWGDTVTNELYLYVSYFVAAAVGVVAAAMAALWLWLGQRQLLRAPQAGLLGRILRRIFPTWLILAVLLGFMSVTYYDCSHESYDKIVAHRGYLENKTQEQAAAMARYLAVAILAYAFVLVPYLWSRSAPRKPDNTHADPQVHRQHDR